MSATGSVCGFSEFDDLCKGHQGYSYNLAELFNSCDLEKCHGHNHVIGFKEALKRLKAKIKDSFLELHIRSGRQITEFTIGKTFVKQRIGVTFNTMKPTTWSLGGGINGRWQDYKNENYDGLIVIGCVERDLIPLDVKSNNYMGINQQTYALGLEQALIQYFTLYKPDNRLRNKSFDIGNVSKDPYKGGIIYVAYKLEPEMDLEYSDNEMDIKAELEKHALDDKRSALGRLRILLEQNGLYFSGSSSLDGNSFFKACSDQLNILGMPCMDHVTLREMVTQQLRPTPINDTWWMSYIDNLSNEGEYVCERVVEKMATILDRQITIYFPSYPDGIDEISYNKQASNRGSPLLLAREKFCFQSLRKGEESNTSTLIDPLTTKIIMYRRSSRKRKPTFALQSESQAASVPKTRAIVANQAKQPVVASTATPTPVSVSVATHVGEVKDRPGSPAPLEEHTTLGSTTIIQDDVSEAKLDKNSDEGFICCSGIFIHCFSSKPMTSLKTDTADTEFNGLILCSGMMIHCFTSLPRTKCVTPKKGDNYNIFFTLLALHNNRYNNSLTSEMLKAQLSLSVNLNESIACRYMLSQSAIFGDDVDFLKSEFENALLLEASDCAKAISWRLVQLFGRTMRHFLNVCIDIWPGLKCRCNSHLKRKVEQTVDFCSSEMVIVVEVECFQTELPVTYFGYTIIQSIRKEKSPEAALILSKLENDKFSRFAQSNTKGLDGLQAQALFSQHSKLSVVSSSPVKSKGFPNHHELIKLDCIQIFCKVKGVIPVGESHFPTELQGIQTDVFEGSSYLLTSPIKVGDAIHSDKSKKLGTLGGFVRIFGQDAFLTCAHVVLDQESLVVQATKRKTTMEKISISVLQKSNASAQPTLMPCGYLRNFVFQGGRSNETSVDAALVAIDHGVNIYDVVSQKVISDSCGGNGRENVCLNENFIDLYQSHEMIESRGARSGLQTEIREIKQEEEVELDFKRFSQQLEGIENQFPKPLYTSEKEHFRFLAEEQDKLNRRCPRTCTFFNQIALKSVKFVPGDSGTCIYIRRQPNEYKCIGMAIASHPSGGCIVTPIKAILSAFGLR